MPERHTPGPWAVNYNRAVVAEDDGTMVASVLTVDPDAEPCDPTANANARLIAAAPELFEAARCGLQWIEHLWLGGGPAAMSELMPDMELVRAAIRKAERACSPGNAPKGGPTGEGA